MKSRTTKQKASGSPLVVGGILFILLSSVFFMATPSIVSLNQPAFATTTATGGGPGREIPPPDDDSPPGDLPPDGGGGGGGDLDGGSGDDVIDTTPPSVSIAVHQTADDGIVFFTVTADDDIDGHAILGENGGLFQDNVGGRITITCDHQSGTAFPVGTTTIHCTVTDEAGNPATISFPVTVNPPPPADSTAPVITSDVQGTLGNNGWYTSDVSIRWNVVENESPDSLRTTGCGTTTIGADTTGTVVRCEATSDGGSDSKTVTIKKDATKPVITVSSNSISDGQQFYLGSVPAQPTCTAADATSGINSDGCQVSGYGTAIGSYTLKFTATDNAGNSEVREIRYTVVDPVKGGSFTVSQAATVNLPIAVSGLARGAHEVRVDVNANYQYNVVTHQLTIDKNSLKGTLWIDKGTAKAKSSPLSSVSTFTVTPDLKTISYKAITQPIGGSAIAGTISGTLTFNPAVHFDPPGTDQSASTNKVSLGLTIAKIQLEVKKVLSGGIDFT